MQIKLEQQRIKIYAKKNKNKGSKSMKKKLEKRIKIYANN